MAASSISFKSDIRKYFKHYILDTHDDEVHGRANQRMSQDALCILNDLVKNLLRRAIIKAHDLVQASAKKTLSYEAVALALPPDFEAGKSSTGDVSINKLKRFVKSLHPGPVSINALHLLAGFMNQCIYDALVHAMKQMDEDKKQTILKRHLRNLDSQFKV